MVKEFTIQQLASYIVLVQQQDVNQEYSMPNI